MDARVPSLCRLSTENQANGDEDGHGDELHSDVCVPKFRRTETIYAGPALLF